MVSEKEGRGGRGRAALMWMRGIGPVPVMDRRSVEQMAA
jgi:hypothetical protein